MAINGTNSTTIDPVNTGFPAYLDFDTLRQNAIDYLGTLTGKIWTDYNLHDPGITTIEMLCYALLDLGYRTNFPAADIFTRDPSDTSTDNNFFTPSQILTCNPLTVIDYRKMLIDIDGVKNAWLEVAQDQKDLCRSNKQQNESDPAKNNCIDFLNGLYHVYIELENPGATESEQNSILDNVRKALMSHRNFCEDFVDIYILCATNIGVCADIDLDSDADIETVYKNIIEALQEFFSPSPKFYTLPELLGKQIPIEDIFAGRPYNVTESYGFVITSELQAIELKKEIHLSDVYQVVFNVPGVKTVRRLRLMNCSNKSEKINWKFKLAKNSIANLSVSCSGFQFTQNGKSIQQDLSKLNQYLDLGVSSSAKILYKSPSPYLDAEIPKGVYRKGIGDYYSIQNEFPQVYGIGDGGLPASVTNQRKAQALQFKAYLLFFDQLLADYLCQLKNIRGLFALRPSGNNEPEETYFWQQLTTVPDYQKLIASGSSGKTLGIPVSKKKLQDALQKTPLNITKIAEIISTPYAFASAAERSIAISELAEDVSNVSFTIKTQEDYSLNTLQVDDNCWAFFMFTSSDEIAIASTTNFQTESDALQALNSLQYLAGFTNNFSSYLNADGDFSFNILSNVSGYTDFLQRIVEGKSLYRERKATFLDHLLSRFAEQFTDYALLSYNFMKPLELQDAILQKKQNFLTGYDVLSSSRGMGYNYSTNYRNGEIVSGFEKRVAALAGFDDSCYQSLCNFVVDEFEEQFIVQVKFGDKLIFTTTEKFYSVEQAEAASKSIFTSLQAKENYETYFDKEKYAYSVKVVYNQNKHAFFEGIDADENKMNEVKNGVIRFFSTKPFDSDVHVSQKVFRIIIRKPSVGNKEIFSSKQFYADFEKAKTKYKSIEKNITKPSFWDEHGTDHPQFQKIFLDGTDPERFCFINLNAFKIDIDDNIVGKPGKFSFALLDHANNFKLTSLKEFDTYEQAEENCKQLIVQLNDAGNSRVKHDKITDKYFLEIVVSDETVAESTSYKDQHKAEHIRKEIIELVNRELYSISIEERNYRWQFEFYFGKENGNQYLFRSIDEFENPENAINNATDFFGSIENVSSVINATKLQLSLENKNKQQVLLTYIPDNTNEDLKKIQQEIDQLLIYKKEVIALSKSDELKEYEKFVNNDILNRELKYVYRLVDKDHLHAVYIKKDISPNSKDAANEKRKQLFQDVSMYDYLDICLGGDIFRKRTDEKTGQTWYHYQVKSRNILFAVKDLILFESVQGYASEDEAQQAFDAIYLQIFKKAMDEKNYGNESYISFKEQFVYIIDPVKEIKSIVFIPDKTKEIIAWYNEDVIKKELAKTAKKYPVRFISNSKDDAKEFSERFPCEPPAYKPSDNCCTSGATIVYYYFYVLTDNDGNEIWQSINHFVTADEARSKFYFFFSLLFYPGNYFVKESLCRCFEEDIKDCSCGWGIYIREVLAESKDRFESIDKAWNKVEEFICVAQSKDAFHTYFNHHSCGNSFFVSCGPQILIHPCKYKMSKSRDDAKEKLSKAINDFYKNGNLPFLPVTASGIIYDIDGNELAKLTEWKLNDDDKQTCREYLKLVNIILDEPEYAQDITGFSLKNKEKKIVAQSINNLSGFEEWKKKLREFAYYFPVSENTDNTFCVEIKLPGFNHFGDDIADDEPCGCGKLPVKRHDACYVTWKSRCCFTSCWEALQYYFNNVSILKNSKDYKPVFYCDCNDGFGIELIPDKDIIAFNPQSYLTDQMDCAAVSRAKQLINAEGLHVVEHILLRPRCETDCRECDGFPKGCNDEIDCNFKWQAGDKNDPCNNPEETICFVPGIDPYSFIATIALPSWPQRFRSAEAKNIIENLLQREAPAHVLLRILWLTPHDLCRFEHHFRKWNYWLTWDKHCLTDYNVCEFPKFLFTTKFKCLDDCTVCLPCERPVATSCFNDPCDQPKTPGLYEIVNQINQVFCWDVMECAQIEKPKEKTKKNLPGSTNEPLKKEDSEIDVDEENKIDERFTRYRSKVNALLTVKNDLPSQTLSFLNAPPSLEAYKEITAAISTNEKPDDANKIKLTIAQRRNLIEAATFYYIDHLVFNKPAGNIPDEVKAIVGMLKKAKINPDYAAWEAKEVRTIKPSFDTKIIYRLLK